MYWKTCASVYTVHAALFCVFRGLLTVSICKSKCQQTSDTHLSDFWIALVNLLQWLFPGMRSSLRLGLASSLPPSFLRSGEGNSTTFTFWINLCMQLCRRVKTVGGGGDGGLKGEGGGGGARRLQKRSTLLHLKAVLWGNVGEKNIRAEMKHTNQKVNMGEKTGKKCVFLNCLFYIHFHFFHIFSWCLTWSTLHSVVGRCLKNTLALSYESKSIPYLK